MHIQFVELPVFDQERAKAWQPGRTIAEFWDSEGNRMVITSR